MSTNASRGKQVFINTLAGLFGNTGSALIGLAITPYLIYRLGFETYGFWIVLSTIVNYVGLIDFGLETTFVKYTAEYAATRQAWRVRQVTTFGVAFYTALSCLMAPIAFLVAPFVIGAMKVSPALAAQGSRWFALIIVAFFLQSAAGVIGSVLAGIGSLRLVSMANFIARLVYAVAAVWLCAANAGIDGLVIATFVQITVMAVICYVFARKAVGRLFTNPFHIERDVLRKLFRLGGWIQLTNLCSTITMETNRLIIAVFVQTSAVTLFEVANKLTRTVRSLPFNFIVAVLPAISALDASEGGAQLSDIYARVARYMNLATVALLGYVLCAAEPITRAWLGHSYPILNVLVTIIGISYIASNTTTAGTTILRAIGQPRLEALYSVVNTAVSVAAMLVLIPRYGVVGVAGALLLGSVVSSAYFLLQFRRLPQFAPSAEGFFPWQLKLAFAGLVATATTWGSQQLFHFHTLSGRPGALFQAAIAGLVYLVIFGSLLGLIRFFSSDDAKALRRISPGVLLRFLDRKGKSLKVAA